MSAFERIVGDDELSEGARCIKAALRGTSEPLSVDEEVGFALIWRALRKLGG